MGRQRLYPAPALREQTALPREFQLTTSTLYDSRRNPSLNSGSATLNPNSTNVNTYLTSSIYFKYFDYEYAIEENLHAYVHCTVAPPSTCPVAHMGDVPVAANDPIFYLHHANIDRLWACWQHLHPNPSGAWQTDRYQFVDETGAPQSKKVSDVLDTAALGYVYDNVAQCIATSGTSVSIQSAPTPPQAQAPSVSLITSAANVRVTSAKTSVDLPLSRTSGPQLFSFAKPTTIELVLVDLTAKSPPGVAFDVYIAKKDSPENRQFVATISWFGVFRHHGSKEPTKRTLSYDVTDAVRKLGAAVNTATLTVLVEATTGLTPVNASSADVMRAEAAKSFRSQAGVEIRKIELRQSGQGAP
jgi:Common central domain of tyrosinase/Polyphenol oxidase middle domain